MAGYPKLVFLMAIAGSRVNPSVQAYFKPLLGHIYWHPIGQRKSRGQPQSIPVRKLHPRWDHGRDEDGKRNEEFGPIIPPCSPVAHRKRAKGFLLPIALSSTLLQRCYMEPSSPEKFLKIKQKKKNEEKKKSCFLVVGFHSSSLLGSSSRCSQWEWIGGRQWNYTTDSRRVKW